jgi:hypothetical protein
LKELNLKLLQIIHDWDPYKTEQLRNDAEAADVLQFIHSGINVDLLGKEIKKIYDNSFEADTPLPDCLELAEKVHKLFINSSC